MEDSLISIVVPVYHVPKDFLKKCIESIIRQSYKNIEILIPINENDKECTEICQNFQNQDERIKIIYENTSLCNARNVGEKNAKGKFLMFVDGDDWIEEDMVKDLYENISSEDNIDLTISCVIKDYTNKKEYYNYDKFENRIYKNEECKNLQAELLNFNSQIAEAYAKLFNLEFLKKNDLEFLNNDIGEDLYLNFQAYACSNKIKTIDYVGYNWFFNTKSVSSTKQRNAKKIDTFKFFNECYNAMEKKGLINKKYDVNEYIFLTTIVWYLSYCTKELNFNDICKEYDRSFDWLDKHFPGYKKNKFIGFNKAKGQEKTVRISLTIMLFLHKIHLGKLATYIYSKI